MVPSETLAKFNLGSLKGHKSWYEKKWNECICFLLSRAVELRELFNH
jgi:hypothetical protein